MIIECCYCESKVDCKELAKHDSYSPEEPGTYRVTLLECPICKNALLAGQFEIETGPSTFKWEKAKRLWPEPPLLLDWRIPRNIRESLEEASNCFKIRAYNACAVMCGRALEGICKNKLKESRDLGHDLKEMHNENIIDSRIFEWGEALREKRNIGAHRDIIDIDEKTAKYVLDFTYVICEYIYVLSDKYDDFMGKKPNSEF